MLWATLTYALAIHSALVKANFTLLVGYVIDPNISLAVATEGDTRGDSLLRLYKDNNNCKGTSWYARSTSHMGTCTVAP